MVGNEITVILLGNIAKLAKGLEVVDIQSLPEFLLAYAAILATVAIAFAGAALLEMPVRAIKRNGSTFPLWMVLAYIVDRLPSISAFIATKPLGRTWLLFKQTSTHSAWYFNLLPLGGIWPLPMLMAPRCKTGTATKIRLVDVGRLAAELLSAIVASYKRLLCSKPPIIARAIAEKAFVPIHAAWVDLARSAAIGTDNGGQLIMVARPTPIKIALGATEAPSSLAWVRLKWFIALLANQANFHQSSYRQIRQLATVV